MELLQSTLSNGLGTVEKIGGSLGGAALLGGAAVKGFGFTKVPEGAEALKLRGDRAKRIHGKHKGELYGSVGPGIHFRLPFFQSLAIANVRDRVLELENIIADPEGEQHEIRAGVTWRVKSGKENLYKAMYEVDNDAALTLFVGQCCTSGLRSVLLHERHIAQAEPVDLFEKLRVECGPELDDYGTELRGLFIKSASFSFGQMYRATHNQGSMLDGGLFGRQDGITSPSFK